MDGEGVEVVWMVRVLRFMDGEGVEVVWMVRV